MRIGAREKEILQEIARIQKNALLSFLMSRGSVMRLYSTFEKLEEDAEQKRKYQEYKQRQQRLLKRLERKGLIQLTPQNNDVLLSLSKTGEAYIGINTLLEKTTQPATSEWDGDWTLVMFDVPQEEAYLRQSLVDLLRKIGFIQIQMSNYIFPYKVPELEEFLKRNPQLGTHCQIFRGSYQGDDSLLREQFDLSQTFDSKNSN